VYPALKIHCAILLPPTEVWAGIAVLYWHDGQGIESRWRTIFFRTSADRPYGPPSLLYKRNRVSLPEVKWPGRGVDHPTPSSAEVEEKVQL